MCVGESKQRHFNDVISSDLNGLTISFSTLDWSFKIITYCIST